MLLKGSLLRFSYFIVLNMDFKRCPHTWFVKFSHLLTTYRFIPCTDDLMMIHKTTSKGIIALEVFVDDITLRVVMRPTFQLPKFIFITTF